MRPPHQLHGVLDMTPLLGLIDVALALAGLCVLRGLRDRSEAVLLHHLPRDGVDLNLGHHGALPQALPLPVPVPVNRDPARAFQPSPVTFDASSDRVGWAKRLVRRSSTSEGGSVPTITSAALNGGHAE